MSNKLPSSRAREPSGRRRHLWFGRGGRGCRPARIAPPVCMVRSASSLSMIVLPPQLAVDLLRPRPRACWSGSSKEWISSAGVRPTRLVSGLRRRPSSPDRSPAWPRQAPGNSLPRWLLSQIELCRQLFELTVGRCARRRLRVPAIPAAPPAGRVSSHCLSRLESAGRCRSTLRVRVARLRAFGSLADLPAETRPRGTCACVDGRRSRSGPAAGCCAW